MALPLRILIPLIVACALFMENLDSTVLSTALPAIGRELHESPIQLKLALASYLLTLAVFIPASGWFADRFGARTIFRLAILIFALGSIFCGFATSIHMLVAARALQGAGGAMMMPVGRLVILRSVPRSEFVDALAWLTIPALIGPMLGPPLGGFITTYFSWRWIFWINIPVAVLGLVLATLFIPEIVEEDPPPFDLIGFILSGVGLSALVWASATMEGNALPVWAVWVLFAIGLVCVALYALHAARTANPILDLRLFRLPTFKAGVIGGSFFRIGVGAIPLLWPLLLQLGFGLSPLQSGLMTFVGAVGAMLMKFTASPILRRLGFRRVLVVNVIITAIFGVAPASFTITSPHLWILTVFFIGGFFRSLQFTCINAISVAEVEQPEMSQATTLTSVFQQLSLSLGITIAAFILQSSMALRGSQTLATGDFLPAFVVIGAISLLSYFSFASLPPSAGEELAGRKRVASAAVAMADGRSYGRS